MLLAHISDFHVFSDQPETRLVRPDVAAVARKVVEDMARFAPGLDGVLFTGDLTDTGTERDYALLKDILSPLQMPIFVVPGNHDRRAAFRSAFASLLPFGDGRFLNYEARFAGVRVLALDTLVEGRGDGALEDESLDWLRARLFPARSEPTLVLLHHPPFPSGIASLDRASLTRGGEELASMIAAYEGPLMLFAGHIHRPYKAMWKGAYCAVAGSPAFQMGLDLAADDHEPPCVSEPYAYFVYQLDSTGGICVHTRYVSI